MTHHTESASSAGSGPPIIVGIGASAGGLEALEELFSEMPLDTGLAFTVIQHLSPKFESKMDDLLARQTRLEIRHARHGELVRPDTIYLAPPRELLLLSSGCLLLSSIDDDEVFTLPIDQHFFSLAEELGERAVGVVLSGTGSDGSRGAKVIREAGGLIICQDPCDARFSGMPSSVIEAGTAHAVLPSGQIPSALASPPDRGSIAHATESARAPSGLEDVFGQLREAYGLDFAHYKPSTVTRRIERRLAMTSSADVASYARRLRDEPRELEALYRDLLIGVTEFFRDEQAFERLDTVLVPELIDKADRGTEIRVWVPGCATGEEAYSLAMVFHENLVARGAQLRLRIFATDVHQTSLDHAGNGVFPEAALAHVSQQRRERYFRAESDGYLRVAPELRELVVFARHNVISDAPFTRIDLISCRNLLIYLGPQAQKKALSLFHFALRSRGLLMLGPSETPGALSGEFEAIDRRWKIYRKRRAVRLRLDPRLPQTPLQAPIGREARAPAAAGERRVGETRLLRSYDQLLARHMPPSLLVDEQHQLIHTFGEAGRLLRLPAGRVSTDVLELVPPDLKTALAGALQHAAREHKPVRYNDLDATIEAARSRISLTVEPLHDRQTQNTHFLVALETLKPEPVPRDGGSDELQADREAISRDYIASLESELRYTKESLQATIEELETSNEELQATNEELVSSNEELQSTNEELHSVNEELYTVNAEHQRQIASLRELTDDMDNLLHNLDVGVVFLDRELRVRRFTEKIAQTFNLMQQDIGRRFDNFSNTIEHPGLMRDVRTVLERGTAIEREVRSHSGQDLFLRILPYRANGEVTGVLITLIDVGTLKAAQADVRQLSAIVESSADAIFASDLEGKILSWNRGAERLYGFSAKEAVGASAAMLVPRNRRGETEAVLERVAHSESVAPFETVRRRRDGHAIDVSISLSPLNAADGRLVGISSIARDISARRQAERQVRRSVEQRDQFLAMLSHELRNPLMGMLIAAKLLDGTASASQKRAVDVIVRQTDQMARLLDDLLDVSRMRRDKIEMRMEPFDLRQISRPVLDSVRPRASNAEVELELTAATDPVWIDGDRARLQQLAVNLLNNAIKYTRSGGRVALAIDRDDATGEALVTVVDEGVGIPRELHEAIFEPFHQGEQPLHGEPGMGLGLALVRSIARAHGGRVSVASDGRDEGTAFTVRLPGIEQPARRDRRRAEPEPALPTQGDEPRLADELGPRSRAAKRDGTAGADDGAVVSRSDAAEERGENGGARRAPVVLLVEDQVDNLELLTLALDARGYQVIGAATGANALAALEQHRADVAVIDIGLPDMSGLEVARRARSLSGANGALRLVALTGHGRQEDRDRVVDAGFDVHLVKPVDIALLSAVIEGRESSA